MPWACEKRRIRSANCSLRLKNDVDYCARRCTRRRGCAKHGWKFFLLYYRIQKVGSKGVKIQWESGIQGVRDSEIHGVRESEIQGLRESGIQNTVGFRDLRIRVETVERGKQFEMYNI